MEDQRLPGDPARQPLNEAEKALRDRAYRLYAEFYEQLREEHDSMRRCREVRARRPEGGTAPGLNTLGSCADSVIAEQIDQVPEAVLLPEREETARSAEEMSDVVSYCLYQAGWPARYQTLMEDAVVTGTGVCQVFWDPEAQGGEGMVSVIAWHPEDFLPDPMAEDIQDGRAVFKATHTTVEWAESRYPHAAGYISPAQPARDGELPEGVWEGGERRATLLEYWYKRYDPAARRSRVHMALLCGGALLYSTELGFGGVDAAAYRDGVYAHGQYPFVLYRFRSVWRRPFGTGLIHDYRDTQDAIDRYCRYIDDNARMSSIQRYFIRRNSGVSAEEVADLSRRIIEWDGDNIGEILQTVQAQPINAQVYDMLQLLSQAMKEDCGENRFARGEGGNGVTAAAAVTALQQAGSKIARWHAERFRDSFRETVEQLLWVLSEYMTPGRVLCIVGGWNGAGRMGQRRIEVHAPLARGDALPRPAYTVRVQARSQNPEQIREDNAFILQAAELCARCGSPMKPETILSLMNGVPMRARVLEALEKEKGEAVPVSGDSVIPEGMLQA